jgi:uncharacterized spore protein YtfJ
MDPMKGFERLRDAMSHGVVFGEPVEREGITLVPAATVFGGGGFGSNDAGSDGQPPAGAGGGYGLAAWPAGAFEVRDDSVRWHPAFDRTQIAASAIFLAYLLLRALASRRR